VLVRRVFITGMVVAGVALAGAAPAAAQGKGKGLSKGRGPTPAVAPVASSASPAVPIPGIRQFGAWLDDASLLEPGSALAAISLGLIKSAGGRQTDFPIVDAAIGLTPRVQLGLIVPYYRLTFADGSQAAGLGDVYLASKISVVDPAKTASGFGLAVSPLLEVLADPYPLSDRRFHVGLPMSVEWRQPKYRLYGSSGWFSRGAFFTSGAVEIPLTERVVATGVLSHTRSLKDDPTADAIGMSKARTDLMGGAAFFATPSLAIYGSLGRTISAQDANAASFMLGAGVSMTFAGPTPGR
jgi:hypothetical protein